MIPDILSKALSVTFDTNVGHDYLENADGRFDFYHKKEDKIAFDLDMFNVITGGGIPRKTLNIILAGTGCGKSLGMCHMASAALAQGRNVLYITLEMAEEKIAERIDANLFDTRIDQIVNLSKDTFNSKVKKISEKTHGKLIIKEYPTAAAHCGHFRALLNELKLKKNFVPDIIYVDYLNICASSRMKGLSGSINTYSLIKSIAEEIRGLAVEFNVPIWSATQVTRAGFSSSDVEITDTSESFGLPATADLMLAFIRTEQLDKMNQIMVKQLKNRYNDPTANKRFTVGVDLAKMRLYDIADPTANISGESSAPPPVASTPFSAGTKAKNFSGFKV
jgi:replicative DNA helicase